MATLIADVIANTAQLRLLQKYMRDAGLLPSHESLNEMFGDEVHAILREFTEKHPDLEPDTFATGMVEEIRDWLIDLESPGQADADRN
jgi:hypothetical protein